MCTSVTTVPITDIIFGFITPLFFQVNFLDINKEKGEELERTFADAYGSGKAKFFCCDVTSNSQLEGMMLWKWQICALCTTCPAHEFQSKVFRHSQVGAQNRSWVQRQLHNLNFEGSVDPYPEEDLNGLIDNWEMAWNLTVNWEIGIFKVKTENWKFIVSWQIEFMAQIFLEI